MIQPLYDRRLAQSLSESAPDAGQSPDDAAQLFRLLSDATRLRIVQQLLRHGELHVRALCEMLHQGQPGVSHHLALLRLGSLVSHDRRGKYNFYRIKSKRVEELLRVATMALEEAEPRLT